VLERIVGSSVVEIVTQTSDDQRQLLHVSQVVGHLARLTTEHTHTPYVRSIVRRISAANDEIHCMLKPDAYRVESNRLMKKN